MDVPKSDFQDAAGAKVHFLEHPLEQTFRLFLQVDLVKRKKQTQVQTEMTKNILCLLCRRHQKHTGRDSKPMFA